LEKLLFFYLLKVELPGKNSYKHINIYRNSGKYAIYENFSIITISYNFELLQKLQPIDGRCFS